MQHRLRYYDFYLRKETLVFKVREMLSKFYYEVGVWYLGIIPYTLLICVRFSFVVHIEEFLWGHVGNYLALSGGGSRLTSITDCHMYMFENLIYIVGSIS